MKNVKKLSGISLRQSNIIFTDYTSVSQPFCARGTLLVLHGNFGGTPMTN